MKNYIEVVESVVDDEDVSTFVLHKGKTTQKTVCGLYVNDLVEADDVLDDIKYVECKDCFFEDSKRVVLSGKASFETPAVLEKDWGQVGTAVPVKGKRL